MNKIIYFAAFFILFAVSVYSQNLESLNNKLSLLSQNLEFIENKGQIADQHGNVNWDVLFIAEVENGTIAIRKDGISFTFVKYDKVPSLKKDAKDKIQGLRDKFQEPEPVNVDMYRVDMNLNNAQIPTRITKKEMTEDYNNYYLAHCPDGVTFVRKYRTVVLENVYQNIDLVLYSNQENKFQYDFVLKPGANPDLISLRFDGAEDVQISAKGELIVKTPFGNIEQKAPVAYQKDDLNKYTNSRILTNNIEIVKSKFRKNKDNSISFIVANYNPEKALIIDPPTRLWGTYYGGGSGDDIGNSVAVDGSRNVYLGGWTYSTDAIATTGSHQSSKGGDYDAILVKFNSSGERQWGTYYGGSDDDYGRSVAVDGSGNVYLGGSTGSTNAIATTGSHQSSYSGGDWDAFLVKFNSSGVRQWGTYYGGSNWDFGMSVAVDGSGNVYLGGSTGSTNAIATTGSHQSSFGGGKSDAFLVKFNSSGVRQWGTYYGGRNNDEGNSVAVYGSGNVYLGGWTYSTNAIATTGSHQSSYGGDWDAFLVKFNSSGVRQWGTYYGGSDDDYGNSVAVDGSGNVYLGGETGSTNAIATTGSHQSSYGGDYDAFLVKFNSSGVRQWGTYYGGSNWDLGTSVAVDGSWNVYLGGWTYSTNAIATTGSHQSSYGGGDWDAYLVKFIDKTTSVEETSKIEKIRIIPNPATYYITISSPLIEWSGLFGSPLAEGQGVFIYNTLGNCVSHTPSLRATLLKEGNIRIDVSHLPPGVYFVRIGTATGMFVKM